MRGAGVRRCRGRECRGPGGMEGREFRGPVQLPAIITASSIDQCGIRPPSLLSFKHILLG